VETMRTTVSAMGGAGSIGITVMEPSAAAQAELIRVAQEEGADWVIIQPPLGPPARPADWLDMLAPLIDGSALPVAIQNATIAGTRLSSEDLVTLQGRAPNLVGVKAETESEDVAAFCEEYGARFRVINGNWGVEYPFFRRHGSHGLIPAPNFVKEQVAIHCATEAGDFDHAEDIHARILPLMQFLRERPAPEAQIVLGRHAYAWRTGIDPGTNRAPGPTAPDTRMLAHAKRLWDRLA
ncbi:MAG: dihydrodipicolinate synthase family protein, partial [Pseudomonadota bacterium]